MPRAVFSLSYRNAAPVPVLVNPTRTELDDCLDTLLSDERRRARARWALRSSGVLWFGDSYTTTHMDDYRGQLVAAEGEARLADVLMRDGPLVHGDLRVVYGTENERRWSVCASMVTEGDYFMRSADVRTLLGCFPAWRRATQGATLTWEGP